MLFFIHIGYTNNHKKQKKEGLQGSMDRGIRIRKTGWYRREPGGTQIPVPLWDVRLPGRSEALPHKSPCQTAGYIRTRSADRRFGARAKKPGRYA